MEGVDPMHGDPMDGFDRIEGVDPLGGVAPVREIDYMEEFNRIGELTPWRKRCPKTKTALKGLACSTIFMPFCIFILLTLKWEIEGLLEFFFTRDSVS